MAWASIGFRETNVYPRIWRWQQESQRFGDQDSGPSGLKANPVWFLASVAQALPGWARQVHTLGSLKFEPAGWKPRSLFLGKHAWIQPQFAISLLILASVSIPGKWGLGTKVVAS